MLVVFLAKRYEGGRIKRHVLGNQRVGLVILIVLRLFTVDQKVAEKRLQLVVGGLGKLILAVLLDKVKEYTAISGYIPLLSYAAHH